jgi:hypothetical protein
VDRLASGIEHLDLCGHVYTSAAVDSSKGELTSITNGKLS